SRTSSADSASVAYQSACGSFSKTSSMTTSFRCFQGRSKVSPKYPVSTFALCLSTLRRLKPVSGRGHLSSRSLRPSSFHISVSRVRLREFRSTVFIASSLSMLSVCRNHDRMNTVFLSSAPQRLESRVELLDAEDDEQPCRDRQS